MLNKLNSPEKSYGVYVGFALAILITLACRFVLPAAPQPTQSTPPPPPPTLSPSSTPTQSPTVLPSVTPQATQSEINPSPTADEDPPPCDGLLIFKLLSPPETTKDLFEHHAKGTFLIFYLEIINLTPQEIQIFSNDYILLIPQGNSTLSLYPHKAATNYLYIVRGGSFYQDKIKPATSWRTYLAFDIDPATTDWQLKISPGSGGIKPMCETLILP